MHFIYIFPKIFGAADLAHLIYGTTVHAITDPKSS